MSGNHALNNSINKENFISALSISIKNKLPGTHAQFKMAPATRIRELQFQKTPANAIEAAVLLCICINSRDNTITIPFIKRSEYEGVHSGQIALPGGKKEKIDDNITATAIREAQEEIGINPSLINTIGSLTPLYIPPSNYIVTPVVAFSERKITYNIDSNEVTELIEINLTDLIQPNNIKDFKFAVNKNTFTAPAFFINGYCIWGATAMIVNEFLEIIRENNLFN